MNIRSMKRWNMAHSSKIIVAGGGAAGMMAAVTAAGAGAEVLLLEPNEKVGRKLYITGKGRCNVTNNCARDELLASIPGTGAFCTARSAASHLRMPWPFLKSWGCR